MPKKLTEEEKKKRKAEKEEKERLNIIKKLTSDKVIFDATLPTKELKKMLKKPQTQRHIIGKNTVLYEAGLKAGFSPEQITGFGSEEALKEAIRAVKPNLIAAMEAKKNAAASKPLPQDPGPKLEDKVLTFNIGIDQHRTVNAVHAAMEEIQIQSELRAKRIRNIQSISIVRSMIPDKKKVLNSQVTVNYKG